MLYKSTLLESCNVRATDGELGKVKDLYFDSDKWAIRYLVVDTQKWLPGRKVVVSPVSFDYVDLVENKVSLFASKQQIENSPTASEQHPLSRSLELDIHSYYGWSPYWVGEGLWGVSEVPTHTNQIQANDFHSIEENESHLRSMNELKGQLSGYTVKAKDQTIGKVVDFIIDDHSWKIHYVMIDTGDLLPGRKIAIETNLISSIDWVNNEIKTNLTSDDLDRETDSVLEVDAISRQALRETSFK
nr:PRC-barrel domain-containing protein [Halalkalibacter akibai]